MCSLYQYCLLMVYNINLSIDLFCSYFSVVFVDMVIFYLRYLKCVFVTRASDCQVWTRAARQGILNALGAFENINEL